MLAGETAPPRAAIGTGDRMTTRKMLKLLTAIAALVLAGAGCGGGDRDPGGDSGEARPNVVLIVIDTLRADRLGCYGAGPEASPRIDELAADGLLFRSCTSAAPITGPSHATMFTSRLPSETGVLNNAGEVSADTPMLAELLRKAGYASGAVASLATMDAAYGFGRGFDTYLDVGGLSHIAPADTMLARSVALLDGLEQPFFAFCHFSDPHEPYNAHGLVERSAEVLLDGEHLATIPTSSYTPTLLPLQLPDRPAELTIRSDDLFTVRGMRLTSERGDVPELESDLERASTRPLLKAVIGAEGDREPGLVLRLSDHIEGLEMFRERYAREVAFADRHVGALLDTLRARGLYDDALIILAGDHGEGLGDHNEIGHVNTLYDSLLRVPLIIKPPRTGDEQEGFTPGEVRDDPAGLVDLATTVLAAVGLPAPSEARGVNLLGDGRSGAPGDGADPQRLLWSETHRPEARHDRFSLRGRGYKVIRTEDTDAWELYDLAADPREQRNIFRIEDPLSRRWKNQLLAARGQIAAAGEAAEPALVDDETRRKLEALGY